MFTIEPVETGVNLSKVFSPMDQQSYELITNDTPIKKNWTMLGGEETEDINDPATPSLETLVNH